MYKALYISCWFPYVFLIQVLKGHPRLASDLLYIPNWPQTCEHLPASIFRVLGLQTCAAILLVHTVCFCPFGFGFSFRVHIKWLWWSLVFCLFVCNADLEQQFMQVQSSSYTPSLLHCNAKENKTTTARKHRHKRVPSLFPPPLNVRTNPWC